MDMIKKFVDRHGQVRPRPGAAAYPQSAIHIGPAHLGNLFILTAPWFRKRESVYEQPIVIVLSFKPWRE